MRVHEHPIMAGNRLELKLEKEDPPEASSAYMDNNIGAGSGGLVHYAISSCEDERYPEGQANGCHVYHIAFIL